MIGAEETTAAAPAAAPPVTRGLLGWIGRLAVALGLLLPVAAELAFRAARPADQLLVGGGYLLACLLFAAVAPARARLDAAAPARDRPRRLLLLLALLLFAVGVYLASHSIRQWVLFPIWVLGIAAWLAAWTSRPRWPGLSRREWVLLGAVTAVAAVLRLYDLGDYQPAQNDEFVIGHITLRRAWGSMEEGIGPALAFAQAHHDGNSQLVLGTYRRLLLFHLAGIDMTTYRLPSALTGVLEVVLVFFLGRLLFGFRAGLVAALVLSGLSVHLSWSRHGLDNIEGSLVWTATGLLLAAAVARRSVALMAMAGTSLSMALYLYLSARPMVAVTLAMLAMLAIDRRTRGPWLARGSLALLGGFAVGVGPLLVTYYRDPLIFTYNANLTSWLGAAIDAYRATGDPAKLAPIWDHFYRALLAYNVVPSADHHYWPGRGLFTPLPAALLYAALALVCLRLSDWRHRLLALWFWAPTLALSALSDYPPPVHRLLPVLPGCALLIGLGFDRIVASWERLGGPLRRAAAPFAGLVLVGVMLHEAAFYFGDYALRDLDPWQNGLVRRILAAPPGQHVVVLTGHQPVELSLYFSTNMGRRNSYEGFLRPVDHLPDPAERPNGVLYMLHSDRLAWLGILRDAYPDGRAVPWLSPDPEVGQRERRATGRLMWMAYEVGPGEAADQRGLAVAVTDQRGRRVELRAPSVVLPELPADLAFPVDVEWRGWFQHRPLDGRPNSFESTGTVAPVLWLGDARLDLAAVGPSLQASLPPGGQPLYARARVPGPSDSVQVRWDGSGHAAPRDFPLDQAVTWPGQPRVVVDWLTIDGRQLLRREYDAMVADFGLGPRQPRNPPLLVRYSGQLQITRPGAYEFQLQADGPVRFEIGDRQVWPITGPAERPGGPPERSRVRVTLPAGQHPFVIERVRTEGGQVALLWRDGEEMTIVPPGAFAPLDWPRS